MAEGQEEVFAVSYKEQAVHQRKHRSDAAVAGLAAPAGVVRASVKDMKPFDPFEILGVDSSATDKEIKKAYRQLSLKYHPDKNPDPAAASYFAEFISKAYAALTDEVSRKNYEQYGHPDGPQAVNVGVALPEWVFAKDKKVAPLMLLGLVGCGILLPLVVASWYMLSSNRFAGPNNIMAETLAFYYHSKYSVKESQSLVRIPETLVCAMEFISMPTPAEQVAPLEELRKSVLRAYPDLKDKAPFWKRKASVLKAHMLVLSHLEREGDSIPQALQADLKFVLQKSPLLLEEMFKIATLPRPPHGYGWLAPAMAIVEMQQCLAQALSISARKPQGKPADASTLLLQLPHFDQDVVKKLKRNKIGTLKELAELPAEEQREQLSKAGLSSASAEEVATFLSVMPTAHVLVKFEMEGEDEIMEQDVAKCKVRLVVTRPSHNQDSFTLPAQGKSVRAFAPLFPLPRDENWYVILADPATNSVLSATKVNLLEAERVGFERPEVVEEWAAAQAGAEADSKKDGQATGKAVAAASRFISRYGKGSTAKGSDSTAAEVTDAQEAGQLVELMFMAPLKAGKYDLQVHVLCDSYVGCDRILPVRLVVAPLTRAAKEGRDARSMAKAQQWASDDESDAGDKSDGKERAGRDSDTDDSGSGSEDESDYDYDSDETGELESGSDEEYEEKPKKKSKAKVEKTPSAGDTKQAPAAAADDEDEGMPELLEQ
eukprot:CAMPEP_0202862194 /NCGR_PEP_ID=MMETSP1391-20130828/3321_1 /ASSEMBLY_ACC=CAM_ASM_000867 /TAXON_ID=1034604 /ORGANISM="Chlamydomonas leiostraca, Strain SAG 11-49" /LENGTH=714 /DNA_ID=CAMNT_0049541695 /DNA_START=168 /DNA_END=2313 /DNA_ORIENTATION=+